MQVTEIVVSAGRTFNHPYESYSNLKPQVTMKAALGEGEDPIEATRQLQAKAEELVESHKRNMLDSLERLEQMSRREQEIADLERTLRQAQARLDQARVELGRQQSLVAPADGGGEAGEQEEMPI